MTILKIALLSNSYVKRVVALFEMVFRANLFLLSSKESAEDKNNTVGSRYGKVLIYFSTFVPCKHFILTKNKIIHSRFVFSKQ